MSERAAMSLPTGWQVSVKSNEIPTAGVSTGHRLKNLGCDRARGPAARALRSRLEEFGRIPEDQWIVLEKELSFHSLKSGETFLEPGDDADIIIFVYSGMIKSYMQSIARKQFTKMFIREHQITSPYASVIKGVTSNIGYVALEDSQIIVLRASFFESLFDCHPVWERIARKLTELYLIERDLLHHHLMTLDAEGRYLAFLETYPEIAARVAQYEIASFLGITPVTLSNVRRKRVRTSVNAKASTA